MKNHLIFKLIAIVLCAASLLGAAAGFGGVAVLTSGDLYNRTVEEMLEEQVEGDAAQYADWLARNYASTELGGSPQSLVNNQYGGHWFPNRYQKFGYAVLDAEGRELLSWNPEYRDAAVYTRSYQAEGKYIHLVSMETESQQEAREAESRMENYGMKPSETLKGLTLPEEGTRVTHAVFAGQDGSLILEAYYTGDETIVNYFAGEEEVVDHTTKGNQVGYLYYDRQDRLVFRSAFDLERLAYGISIPRTTVGSAYFFSPSGGADVALSSSDGVGQILIRDGSILFQSFESVMVEETVPETVPETTAATIPETAPQETAAAETVPQTETVPETVGETIPQETVASSASAVPETLAVTEAVLPVVEETAPVVETTPETVPMTVPETTAETEPATVPETHPEQTIPPATEPVMINGKRLEEYQVNRSDYWDAEQGERVQAQYVYLPMPELTVEIFLSDGAVRNNALYGILDMVREYRDLLLPAALGCLVLFALCVVYLCTAAGRKPGSDEIKAGGLNRMPLDLYLGLGGLAVGGILVLLVEGSEMLFEVDLMMASILVTAGGFLCCLIFVGFCFAFVAQMKTPDDYWIRNTLCCRVLHRMFQGTKWLAEGGTPLVIRIFHWCWVKTMAAMIWLYKTTETIMLWTARRLGRMLRKLGRRIERFYSMLPIIWQWLVAWLAVFLLSLLILTGNFFGMLLGILLPVCIVIFFAESYGTLADGVRRMSTGGLDTKVDTTRLVGCFRESAADLNALADVAVVAAQKQLKSERMKTELITNVSHDIKTPLTSIINYVDLLQKPHTEEEQAQYLEVLDRQSQRLKKLIDDLMDMSKASTGNMTVEIACLDAVESVNQALGEFADKLSRANLIPVFRHSEDSVPMMADGKLVWRVLSNLLGNAVKYAMPGTRMYIDLQSIDGKVVLSLKNISREELNVDTEELMERFVRGDDSRNTEGSGLGLNIAKSLMELQKGQLQLLIDGDLFKVTLIFPGA